MASRKKVPSAEDFDEILRNGLSSRKSYVVLKQKVRSAVVLQFRPFVIRLSDKVIYLGGKLSAFPDEESQKFQNLSADEQVDVLSSAWRKLPKDRVGCERVGSNAGFYVVAGRGDINILKVKFDKAHMLSALLKGIEEALKVEIDNVQEVKGYLNYFYGQHIGRVFGDSGYSKPIRLPERVVGKKSELLLGYSYVQGAGLSEFSAKIEPQLAKAA